MDTPAQRARHRSKNTPSTRRQRRAESSPNPAARERRSIKNAPDRRRERISRSKRRARSSRRASDEPAAQRPRAHNGKDVEISPIPVGREHRAVDEAH